MTELAGGEKTHAELAAALTGAGMYRAVGGLVQTIPGIEKIIRRNGAGKLTLYYVAVEPEPELEQGGGE